MKKNILMERIFHDINYDNYVVQYQGDIEAEISKIPDYYVTVINDRYAVVSVKKDVEINMGNEPYISSIVYVIPAEFYTLQDISPVDASQASFLQTGSQLNLTGKGVNVAIIDSGIDYLSEEFMDANGETRIENIWDQTLISNAENGSESVPFGVLFDRNKINDAIRASREGGSPDDIVPSRDEIGHGTNMAGIIGASGKNPNLRGVAPDCNFVVVKLIRDFSYEVQFPDVIVPVFNITAIFAALQYVYEYALTTNKPMVIYFPLGSSLGNHKGEGILEDFIDAISSNGGIAVVTGTGNQRDAGGHTSGSVTQIVGAQSPGAGGAELEASPEQKNIWVQIWADLPNIMTVEIVSPSGESSGILSLIINYTINHTFIFEKTSIRVNFYFPEEVTGDELIRIRFYNLQPGIWRIRIQANYIANGRFNAWIPQKGLTVGDTRFSFSDPFGTITNPGNSIYAITVAAYNQNNNNIVDFSGMAFLESFTDRIDVAAGGINALTVAPNNTTAVVSGTSVSAAVVSGVCAMLFQWGIVNGNEPNMYAQTIKAYLAKGAMARSGDITPNPYWGYGILNVPRIFENMT
ncbi:S8 family peptidase [Clostridium beijerinckii]|uniref:S8 family peptidase n=1 Tax=Clostridium beijerinckii TaxID=1520 RepID=A0AAE2RTB5_CLOBE|nr:S8 family peptidase [Clostridium beijerinckii]MBF7811370.1 S8 family peptidase [Clostridium beijerinckii]NRT67726.1 subtilisin family serine protease [Clostridium beijerinckii]NSA13901.1 subtilisin family serine protease [Clostridium beijerinckii]NYC07799.1 subtilisin family serine protease [Clostridium beijerinckii]